MKKYSLTDTTIVVNGRILHQIKAEKSFGDVEQGELGGWVESEKNLSQVGACWVYEHARIYEDAEIYGDAKVCGHAEVYGQARVYGRAEIYGDAHVYGNADICGQVEVYGKADICGNAEVCGNARVCRQAKVCGDAVVSGEAEIYGKARVCEIEDYIVFKNWWSSGRFFTWTKSNNMWKVGCFYGKADELIKKAYEDSETCGKEYERVVRYVESILAND